MAVQNAGLGKGPDPAMSDQTKFNARDGAAKNVQTKFGIHPGMTDQQRAMVGVGPSNPGTGPLADSPNPADPETPAQRGKNLRRQPGDGQLQAKWGMTDANGKGVDNAIGKQVLNEAVLGGAKLPASESYSNASPGKP